MRWLTVDVVPEARWGAPIDEVRALLDDLERVLLARRDELHARGVRIRGLGRRDDRLPRRLRQALDETEALTAGNHGMTLTLAVDHDGRAELAAAMAAIAAEVQAGTLRVAAIDEDVVAGHLDAPDLPDPDLLVRTGGRHPDRELPRLADAPTPSSSSPTPAGPTSAAPTSSTRSPSTSAANAASARSNSEQVSPERAELH